MKRKEFFCYALEAVTALFLGTKLFPKLQQQFVEVDGVLEGEYFVAVDVGKRELTTVSGWVSDNGTMYIFNSSSRAILQGELVKFPHEFICDLI